MNNAKDLAVVFDLDGTLIDSVPDIGIAINKMLESDGRRPLAIDAVKTMVGDGAAKLVERALAATGEVPDGGLPAMVQRFLGFYEGHASAHTVAYPGVVEVLDHLHASGHPLGVCTNKPYAPTMEVLEALGLARFFRAVLGGDSLAVRKPDPTHLTATLAAMGVDDRKAVMVGDSPNDIAAARGAAIPVVAVSFGYSRVPAHELGADLLIGDFRDLPQALAKLWP